LVVLILLGTVSKLEDISVVRGYAFELIDEKGNIRAEIKVLPAVPKLQMPDGSVGYPETVLFRLIDPKGKPN
jgi:hypothetical protein